MLVAYTLFSLQHFTIATLENVQRQHIVGKQYDAGQRNSRTSSYPIDGRPSDSGGICGVLMRVAFYREQGKQPRSKRLVPENRRLLDLQILFWSA